MSSTRQTRFLLKEACDILLQKIDALLEVLKRRAFEFKDTPQIGQNARHSRRADFVRAGLGVVVCRIRSAIASGWKKRKKSISVGKISGAVGAFAHLSAGRRRKSLRANSASKPRRVSTQVIQRDRYAEYLCTLAIIASSLEKIALQVRHWQRTEVREAQEKFKTGQKGSSAMPHKRNPILSERICGMARTVRANSIVGLENVALWHERDISHSSAERIVLPDSSRDARLYSGENRFAAGQSRRLSGKYAEKSEPDARAGFQRSIASGSDAKRRFARRRVCLHAAKRDESLGRRRRISGFGDARRGHFREIFA